ncbi:MAG TPA: hypothetical protein VIF62_16725 [Labilithrix sp.]
MRTPRGYNTLIGNGWLRESPRAAALAEVRSRSALRKCMFLQVPPELRALAPIVTPAHAPPRRKEAAPEPEYRPSDPGKHARMFPAQLPKKHAAVAPKEEARERAWWEDPVAIGSLLILLPPVGLAAVWRSRAYSSDARWALTVMTALTMCLVSAVVIAVLALR